MVSFSSPLSVDFSVVSHGHGALVMKLLHSLEASLAEKKVQVRVLLTLNLPEPKLEELITEHAWSFELLVIRNPKPMGFGANHNQAFLQSVGDWFAVINPDILWPSEGGVSWTWLEIDQWEATVGMLCPVQVDAVGRLQDYARELTTPWGLGWRVLRRLASRCLGRSGYVPAKSYAQLEQAAWVNGACMIFKSNVFAALQGFDKRYFMYCEDVDICLRMQQQGYRIADAGFSVIHDAQRNTLGDTRHLRWHVSSLLQLWCSSAFWGFVWQRHRLL